MSDPAEMSEEEKAAFDAEDMETWAESARHIISSKDVLSLFAHEIRFGPVKARLRSTAPGHQGPRSHLWRRRSPLERYHRTLDLRLFPAGVNVAVKSVQGL